MRKTRPAFCRYVFVAFQTFCKKKYAVRKCGQVVKRFTRDNAWLLLLVPCCLTSNNTVYYANRRPIVTSSSVIGWKKKYLENKNTSCNIEIVIPLFF